MRTNGKQPVVLLSLNLGTVEDDIAALKAVGITSIQPGHGCFEGNLESCYAVPIEQFSVELRNLLRERNQKAVFFLDNQYNAWLATADKDYTGYTSDDPKLRAVYVGEFKETSEVQARKAKGWSEFGGRYFVAGR